MGKSILVIDDTKKILILIKISLEKEGYEVMTASDPLEGIKLAQENPVDLVILDVMMPKMDGYEVAEALHRDPRTNRIPILLLTARAVLQATKRQFLYTVYGYMAKPFHREMLLAKVEEILSVVNHPSEAGPGPAGEQK